MTASSPPGDPAALSSFSEREQALIWQAQRDLIAKRQANLEFRRVLRESEQRPLFPPPAALGRVSSAQGPQAPLPPRTGSGQRRRLLPTRRITFPTAAFDPDEMTGRTLFLAEPQLASLRPGVQARARAVFRALVEAAYTLVSLRGQSRHVTSSTFFTVLDTLPVVTGLSAATCERALADLRALGLISTRRWYTQGRFRAQDGSAYIEQTCCGGVFLCVLLRAQAGARARVRPEDTEHTPRDLHSDRKTGRTAWQHRQEAKEEGVRESSSYEERKVLYMHGLLLWALKERTLENSVEDDSLTTATSPADVVWGLSQVLSTAPQGRGEAIGRAAHALSALYRDPKSFRHYCRLLHRAVAAEFRGLPALARLQFALQRVLVHMNERDLRRPGAVLVRELQDNGWWEEVYRAV